MALVVKPRKVGIIGNGHVGSHVAYSLAIQGVADEIYLVDSNEAVANSQAIDIQDAVAYMPHRVLVIPCSVKALAECDVIVVSVAPAVEAKSNRLEELPLMLHTLVDVIAQLRATVMPTFQGVLLCISNPADVVAAYLQKALKLPAHRVICTGTSLDSARLQAILARELRFEVSPISLRSAYVIGEHGDSSVIAWSTVRIGNKPLDQLQREQPARYPPLDRAAILNEMRGRGYEVYCGKNSTEFGIATAATEIIKAILHNEQKVLPCSVLLRGQYGESGVFASVPVVVGGKGVEDIMELELAPQELADFRASCQIIREFLKKAMAQVPI